MDTTITDATPMKLRDGTWGARASYDTDIGDIIRIRTRAGKTWLATVTRIQECSLFDRETHCATQSMDRKPAASPRRSRGTWTGCTCGSVEEYEKSSDCWNCRHDR